MYDWYSRVLIQYKGICPNCGYDLAHAHPLHNLAPHSTGACKDYAAKVSTKALNPLFDWGPEDLEEFRKMGIRVP